MLEEGLGRLAPKEARLQLARRPLIIGVASSQAAFAAAASLNVTYNVITMIMMIFLACMVMQILMNGCCP